jgi:hypothetical protein
MRLNLWAAVWLALFVGAAAAAPVPAGPHATATELRALAGAKVQPVTRLTFDDVTDKQTVLALDLAPDYFAAEYPGQKAPTQTVHDFKLRRQFIVQLDKRRFINISHYANISSRTREFQRRIEWRGMLKGFNAEEKSLYTTFVNQSELGLTLPSVALERVERSDARDGTVALKYDGDEVARIRFSDTRLPESAQKSFARFLRHGIMLHPTIVETVLTDGRIPQVLTIQRTNRGGQAKTRTLTLKSVELRETDYPISADYVNEPLPVGANPTIDELLPLMLAAIKGKHASGPPNLNSYVKALEAARREDKPLLADLINHEATYQHGMHLLDCKDAKQGCSTIFREVMERGRKEPRLEAYNVALIRQGFGRPDAADRLRSIDRSGLAKDYVLDFLTATAIHDPSALDFYARAIRGNPYAPAFYVSCGDFYRKDMRSSILAWFFFDLARNLPEADKSGFSRPIDKLEEQFTKDYPQLF